MRPCSWPSLALLHPKPFLPVLGCLLLVGTAPGCRRETSQVAPADIPVVPVSHPVEREVTDYVDFTGRTDAVQSVNIVARVTGFLVEIPFTEGSEVKAGELLFKIDPRPYQAQYEQAQGQVNLAQAQLDLAEKTLARFQALKKDTPGAVSDQAIDQYQAAVAEAKARVQANKKSLEIYRLNKDFTRVVSPINGQVSRYYLTLGNLVNQDQTQLTTVVSLEPIYAYFDMDERTLLRIRTAINQGKLTPRGTGTDARRTNALSQLLFAQGAISPGIAAPVYPQALAALGMAILGVTDFPVLMGLQGEDGYPHRGTINFANNQVNPGTGSISVRGVFPNPKPKGGVRLLSPGMFVRIRLPIGQRHRALLVIDRAVQSDQGLKYVYVVDADNQVRSRRVTTGALQEDGLRVISEGLKPEEWVVVGGAQQVRPNMEVRPDRRAKMPSFGNPDGGEAAAGPGKPAGQNP